MLLVPPPVVDLPSQATTVIRAPVESLAPAGDFNGDGIGDIVAGVPEVSQDRFGSRAGAMVIFGRRELPRDLSLAAGGPDTLLIRGRAQAVGSDPPRPIDVAAAGDVNGDGLADVAVGAPSEAAGLPLRRTRQGQPVRVLGVTYVVFGRRSGGTLELDRLGPADGFAIRGAGDAVEAVGDVNGDGREDLAVASFRDDALRRVHVVYGGRSGAIRLIDGRIGPRGWTIEVDVGDDDELGSRISGAGDVNADGLADLAIAASPRTRTVTAEGVGERTEPATVHVLLGRRTNAPLRLDAIGQVHGPGDQSLAATVLGPGDVNGDGRPDVVIGAPLLGTKSVDADRVSDFGPGGVALLTAPLQRSKTLADLPILLRGPLPAAFVGVRIARAGDVDGDGRADVLASGSFLLGEAELGPPASAYLLRADGQRTIFPGRPAAPVPADAADVTGDGRPELMFTMVDACRDVRALVVDLSRPLPPAPGAGSDAVSGTAGRDLLYGGTGDDVIDGLAERDCIQGDEGADVLLGGAARDIVVGGTGDDRIMGGPGADDLIGSAGSDRVLGGAGLDAIYGAAGDDLLDGGANRGQQQRANERRPADRRELLDGGDGSDELRGAEGDDRLEGWGGDDFLLGGPGDDSLEGGDGSDYVVGGPGRDIISTGAAESLADGDAGDEVSAGPGDDRIGAVNRGRDVIRCGPGRDTVHAEPDDRVSRDCEKRVTVRRPRAR